MCIIICGQWCIGSIELHGFSISLVVKYVIEKMNISSIMSDDIYTCIVPTGNADRIVINMDKITSVNLQCL